MSYSQNFLLSYYSALNILLYRRQQIIWYMEFRTLEGWRFVPVAELPRPKTHLLILVEIRNPKFLNETQEPEFEPIEKTMIFLNFSGILRETEGGFRLSVDSDSKEQRAAAAAGYRYFTVRNVWRERRHFNGRFFSDTSKFSVLKQANRHDASSSCCLSLFVAINILEQSDANFNSVQVRQSSSKSSDPPFVLGSENWFLVCCYLTFQSYFQRKTSNNICVLSVQTCRLEICSPFSLHSIFTILSKLKLTIFCHRTS